MLSVPKALGSTPMLHAHTCMREYTYLYIIYISRKGDPGWSPLCKEGKSPLQLQLQLYFLFILAYVHVCWVICKRRNLCSASSQHRHGIALLLLKYWLRARERAQQVKVSAVQVWGPQFNPLDPYKGVSRNPILQGCPLILAYTL